MGWMLTTFGSVTLPNRLFKLEAPLVAVSSQIALLGGKVFDAYWPADAPLRLPLEVRWQARLLSDTDSELFADLAELTGLTGKVDTLTRETSAGDDQTCTARLVSVSAPRELGMLRHQDVEMTFQLLTPWLAAADTEAGGPMIAPATITLTNNGNAPTSDVVIKVTCTAITGYVITAFKFEVTGVSGIQVIAGLGEGNYFEIDTGAKTVKLNGTDDIYSSLTFTPNQTQDEWLVLEPGDTDLIFTFGLTGSPTFDIEITYRDTYQ